MPGGSHLWRKLILSPLAAIKYQWFFRWGRTSLVSYRLLLGFLDGLILCRSCAYSHSHCEFMCGNVWQILFQIRHSPCLKWAAYLLCLDDHYTLGRRSVIEMFHLEVSFSLLFPRLWPAVGLCVYFNHQLLYKKIKLIWCWIIDNS